MRKGQKASEETKQKMRKAQQRLAKDRAIRKMRSENAKKVEARKRAEEAGDSRLAEQRHEVRSDAVKRGWKNRSREISNETREKISKAGKRRFQDPEEREKVSRRFKGVKKSPEHIAKVQAAKRGWKPTEEQRKNMSRGQQRLIASGYVPPSRKGSRRKKLKCLACKVKFPREMIEQNGGFCGVCIHHLKECDCGCGKLIFRYTREGHTRKLKGINHRGDVGLCKACKKRFTLEVITNGFCDNCVTHTKLCGCGCNKKIFRYNVDGSIKRFASISHAGIAFNKEHQEKWGVDLEYTKWYSQLRSKGAKTAYENNPKLKVLKSEIAKTVWQDDKHRNRMSQIQLERFKDPKERTKLSRAQKKRFEDPLERGKLRQQALGNKSRTGMKDSKTTKEKKRLANIQRYQDPEERKKTGRATQAMWDNNPELHKRMSERVSGEGNPAWNGWTSFEPYDERWTPEFKDGIRSRQHYACAHDDDACKHPKNIALHVHHIDGNKKNTVPENCIALCNSHHARALWNTNIQNTYKTFIADLIQKEAD